MGPVEFALSATALFVAGVVDSIAGGGGLISLPTLLSVGVPPATALGTNKLCSALGTSVATAQYWRNRQINLKLVGVGAGFVVGGGAIGAYAVQSVPEPVLKLGILVLLPIAAIVGLLPRPTLNGVPELSTRDVMVRVPVIATGMGAYDGGFGPGAGTLVILAMNYWLKLPLLPASANAKVFNLLSNLAALASFSFGGHVNYRLGISLVGFSMAGNWIGSRVAIRFGSEFIQQVIRVVLVGLVLTVLVRSIGTI